MNVLFLTCDRMLATSLIFPKEMWVAASHIAQVQQRTKQHVQFHVASLNDATSTNLAGITLPPTTTLSAIEQADVVFIPTLWRKPEQLLTLSNNAKDCILRLYNSGAIFAATGTGSWILAELGILDNKAATTHWFHLPDFKARYPQLNVRDQHLITQADRIYCASSINSLVDLTVHLIETLFDASVARQVEQQFSPEVRQHYRSRVFIDGADNLHNDELVADAQQYIRDNSGHKINFSQLATLQGISQRSLNRRFLKSTGVSPNQYLLRIRTLAARDLLQHSNLSVADIAIMTGFSSATQFSDSFKKSNGMPPRAYRQSIKPKMFSG